MSERIELTLTVEGDEIRCRRDDGADEAGKLDTDKLRKRTVTRLVDLLRHGKLESRDDLALLGEHMFEMLFKEQKVLEFFNTTRARAKKGNPLYLQLRFQNGDDPKREWPWEYLHHPEWSSARFFSTDNMLAFSRAPLNPTEAAIAAGDGPLGVLMLKSPHLENGNGSGDPTIKRVEDGIKRLDPSGRLIDLKVNGPPNESDPSFGELIDRFCPRVFHVVSSGRLEKGKVQISLPAAGGGEEWCEPSILAEKVSWLNHKPDMVVLHLTEADMQRASNGHVAAGSFLGFSQDLLANGIKAVVAMQSPIGAESTVSFCSAFYKKLTGSDKNCIEQAIQSVRWEMVQKGFEFGYPVLFAHRNGNYLVKAVTGGEMVRAR